MNAHVLLHTPGTLVTIRSRTRDFRGLRGLHRERNDSLGDTANVINSLPQVIEVGPSNSVLAG